MTTADRFRDYSIDADIFDEMFHADGRTRDDWNALRQTLTDLSAEELAAIQERVTRSFSNEGITFTVYGDDEADERIIPIDCVPRLIAEAEWRGLEAGLTQRLKALNLFLQDVYGESRVTRDGVIPEDMVFGCPQYRLEMRGFHAAAGHVGGDLRYRRGPHQRRVPGIGGQPPGPFRRIVHDRQPQGGEGKPAPALPSLTGAGGGELRPAAAGHAAGTGAGRTIRPDHRSADTRRLQLRVLRAHVPGGRTWGGAGGGPGSGGFRRLRPHEDDDGPAAGGRDLPTGR